MKHAFLVAAHAHPSQLVRLVSRLAWYDNDVVVHVDAKNDSAWRAVEALFGRHPNVFLLGERVHVNRGGLSVVLAVLKMMTAARSTGRRYRHVTVLSGQDYPIKSPRQVRSFFEQHPNSQFVRWRDIGAQFWRLQCYNFFGEHPRNRAPHVRAIDYALRRVQSPFVRRRAFAGLRLVYGSTWFTITGACMQHVLDYVHQNPHYLRAFRWVYVPDESFFHTIILNGPFRDSVVNDNLTHIDWNGSRARLGSPRTLTATDVVPLVRSSRLFARKFDCINDTLVFDAIDAAAGS